MVMMLDKPKGFAKFNEKISHFSIKKEKIFFNLKLYEIKTQKF